MTNEQLVTALFARDPSKTLAAVAAGQSRTIAGPSYSVQFSGTIDSVADNEKNTSKVVFVLCASVLIPGQPTETFQLLYSETDPFPTVNRFNQ